MGPPVHGVASRFHEMVVSAALQRPFRVDLELILELRSHVRCLHGRRRPDRHTHVRPLARHCEGLSRRDCRPLRALPVATGPRAGQLRHWITAHTPA